MQLSYYPSKLGPGDISQVIYLDLLDILFEVYLVEERRVGKIENYSSNTERSACAPEWGQESHFLVGIVIQ